MNFLLTVLGLLAYTDDRAAGKPIQAFELKLDLEKGEKLRELNAEIGIRLQAQIEQTCVQHEDGIGRAGCVVLCGGVLSDSRLAAAASSLLERLTNLPVYLRKNNGQTHRVTPVTEDASNIYHLFDGLTRAAQDKEQDDTGVSEQQGALMNAAAGGGN